MLDLVSTSLIAATRKVLLEGNKMEASPGKNARSFQKK
jgi:hypothetical protein